MTSLYHCVQTQNYSQLKLNSCEDKQKLNITLMGKKENMDLMQFKPMQNSDSHEITTD